MRVQRTLQGAFAPIEHSSLSRKSCTCQLRPQCKSHTKMCRSWVAESLELATPAIMASDGQLQLCNNSSLTQHLMLTCWIGYTLKQISPKSYILNKFIMSLSKVYCNMYIMYHTFFSESESHSQVVNIDAYERSLDLL